MSESALCGHCGIVRVDCLPVSFRKQSLPGWFWMCHSCRADTLHQWKHYVLVSPPFVDLDKLNSVSSEHLRTLAGPVWRGSLEYMKWRFVRVFPELLPGNFLAEGLYR